MCDIPENGWVEHKRLIYHKIDANTTSLGKIEATQVEILEEIRKKATEALEDAIERGRFEARTDEKVSKLEKFIYGAITVSLTAIVGALLSLIF